MAFLDNQNPPTAVDSLLELRAIDTTGLSANATATIPAHFSTALMRFNPQDGTAENEENGTILPDDRTSAEPGRWEFEAWL